MKVIVITTLILFVLGASFAVTLAPVDPSAKNLVLFEIERGEGARQIGQRLRAQGFISSDIAFHVYALATGASRSLQAGTYELSPSMTMAEITEKIAKGQVATETITVVEGWNLRTLGLTLENKGMFKAQELWELAGFPGTDYSKTTKVPFPKDYSNQYEFLRDKSFSVGLEGYLFPDTYRVYKGEELESIVLRVLDNFGQKIDPFLAEIQAQGKTVFEVVITASLIEKEVQTMEDKKLVSGVIQNRLALGMPLQIDATVSYLTGKNSVAVSREETQIDSAYNTYKYAGLPLGPIANPGIESIEAALFPMETSYLYYLSTPEGQTIFSKTLEEHNAAKARYLQ